MLSCVSCVVMHQNIDYIIYIYILNYCSVYVPARFVGHFSETCGGALCQRDQCVSTCLRYCETCSLNFVFVHLRSS